MCRPGVRAGSNAGVSARITGHQASGTGGRDQPAGSLLSPVWVGTTSVPSGPTASSRACATATVPPGT